MSAAGYVVVADDYGLSLGVNRAIRELITIGKLSGTGCMTLFPEWVEDAAALRALCNEGLAEAGLHLTLTDFAPISGKGPLGGISMPSLGALLKANLLGRIDKAAVEKELDAQLEAFVSHFGRLPDYVDGHQHIHFLPPVRAWLAKRRERLNSGGKTPWIRGGPSVQAAPELKIKAKLAIVSWLARGFDSEMKSLGFPVQGPLLGFYDWTDPGKFLPMLDSLLEQRKDGLMMCHPGYVDDTLKRRDALLDARETELKTIKASELQARRPDGSWQ